MSISEPEAWTFSDTKLHISNLDSSSSDDSSDDEQLFSKTKTLKGKRFKKIVTKEEVTKE
jgi:hypothetical protein|tara:strand:+ start:1973 stop:2152 length:180 start_codon:yes stop_codon:yes gene_type:complete